MKIILGLSLTKPQKDSNFVTQLDNFIARIVKRYLTRKPVLRSVRHSELNILTSVDDDARQSELLLDISLRAIQEAGKTAWVVFRPSISSCLTPSTMTSIPANIIGFFMFSPQPGQAQHCRDRHLHRHDFG